MPPDASQPVDAPLSRSAIFITLTVNRGGDALDALRGLCADLPSLVKAVSFRSPPAGLSCIMGLGADLWQRLRALPGFGEEKAQIFLALLGKRLGVAPAGWEAFAGPFADDEPRSVADIDSREAFDRVRAWKKAKKAAGKTKQD